MNRDEIFNAVQDIFRDVFDDTNLMINDSTNSSTIEDWDSLNYVSLVVAIEKEFEIKFDLMELERLIDVGAMLDLMMLKLK
tara:strand:+ start:206 stop:448 length:243 start_codon:yes stop_codon:yes gene_type:complete